MAELDVLMQAFLAELVLSKTEQQQLRFQEAEALKTELREFVARVEARFGAVEVPVVDFRGRPPAPAAATSATAAATRNSLTRALVKSSRSFTPYRYCKR